MNKKNKYPVSAVDSTSPSPERSAGILLHISSLPGDFGIGDFGPGSKLFINFLEKASQHYWQVLPLSITNSLNNYSPYSSHSAFAGNTMFIDPLKLAGEGLINTSGLSRYRIKPGDHVDFKSAAKAKENITREAYDTFRKQAGDKLQEEYTNFVEKERYWIDDFALYESLYNHFGNQPWNSWPEDFRDRNQEKLREYSESHAYELGLVKFSQFIFSKQWMEVKSCANNKGIKIFGDIPVYIDYNSADVWSHPGLFQLKSDMSMKAVAGVPPDYFNEEGQRWGMPIFNWKAMEKDHFTWWLRRIEKNLQWFDLLRLDHFRGFSAYWEIPAEEKTAVNGKWVKGPGTKLFDAICQRFPGMPFVAEDLGMIDQDVYDLRDRYELPGMKVLQFGFGENHDTNGHYPRNIDRHTVVYTGTHDNNTLKGWYTREANQKIIEQLNIITGKKITIKNVHREMIHLAYGTRAGMAIIPMQDWLGLREKSRMNYPATTNGNWKWRLNRRTLSGKLARRIHKLAILYNRI
jgi:4-alpha-glucanotransferase